VKFDLSMVTTTEVEDSGAVVQHFREQKCLITAIVGHSKGQIQLSFTASKLKFFGDWTDNIMEFFSYMIF